MTYNCHDHDFFGEPIVDVDGQYLIVAVPCTNAELLDSVTDDVCDETYEEYGEECSARRVATYEATTLSNGIMNWDLADDGELPVKAEDALEYIERQINSDDGIEGPMPGNTGYMASVTYRGRTWRLDYDRTDLEVRE